jgi:glycerol-3-phosphate acyltransferase PlsY
MVFDFRILGLGACLVAFLSGSIPFGFLIGLAQGIDIRKHGSGNIGSTNVFRVLGKKWGIIAFICDFLKGFLPVLAVRYFTRDWPQNSANLTMVASGICAILGHNYCPWLGFKGGKGIATSGGVLTAIIPWTFAIAFSLWIILVLIIRIVSIGSIAASLMLPIATYFIYRDQPILLILSFIAGGLGIWRHRANIERLRKGTESKIGEKK